MARKTPETPAQREARLARMRANSQAHYQRNKARILAEKKAARKENPRQRARSYEDHPEREAHDQAKAREYAQSEQGKARRRAARAAYRARQHEHQQQEPKQQRSPQQRAPARRGERGRGQAARIASAEARAEDAAEVYRLALANFRRVESTLTAARRAALIRSLGELRAAAVMARREAQYVRGEK